MKEYGDKVSAEQQGQIENDLQALKDVMDSGDAGDQGQDRDPDPVLDEARRGHVQGPAGREAAGPPRRWRRPGRRRRVVDADFEEVDGDKKGK